MEHIVKTYILLLFSLLVSSIGYAQEENDIIYIQEGKWGVILCGERGYAWLDNKGDTIFGFGKYRKFQLMMTLIWSWLKKPCSEEAG